MFNRKPNEMDLQKGTQQVVFEPTPELRVLMKQFYFERFYEFNKRTKIKIQTQFGDMDQLIDSGSPMNKFVNDFCSQYKDIVKNSNISGNDFVDVIKEVEAECDGAEFDAVSVMKTEKPKTEENLKNKMKPGNQKYLSTILQRTGGFIKFSEANSQQILPY